MIHLYENVTKKPIILCNQLKCLCLVSFEPTPGTSLADSAILQPLASRIALKRWQGSIWELDCPGLILVESSKNVVSFRGPSLTMSTIPTGLETLRDSLGIFGEEIVPPIFRHMGVNESSPGGTTMRTQGSFGRAPL